ncbi:MAG: histidinol dehydrogenase, partial [Actinomycetes bacterium]
MREFLPTPADPGADVADAVAAIIAEVRARGDDAIADLTERFDGVRLASSMVDSAQIAAAV